MLSPANRQKYSRDVPAKSRVLYRDSRTAIGEFRWFAYRAGEKRRSPTGPNPLIVIPWTAVRITQDGSDAVIADTSSVVFYNPHQPYVAEQLLDDQPERSIYIVPDQDALSECVREIDAKSSDDPQKLMRFTHGPCDAKTFVGVRWMVSRLLCDQLDALATQERLLWIMQSVVSSAYRIRDTQCAARSVKSAKTDRRQRDVVASARELLVSAFDEPLGLPEIASAVGCSAYHLCRIFRRNVGLSIHEYRNELRLRASLQHLCESRDDLANVALRVGFSSQSHFTTAFSQRFHRTPAAFRADVHG